MRPRPRLDNICTKSIVGISSSGVVVEAQGGSKRSSDKLPAGSTYLVMTDDPACSIYEK